MSDSKNQTRYTGVDRRAPRVEPGAAKAGVALPREVYKTGGRHAAITNSLYNWHSYKNWAEKVRGTWEEKK
jgi:hypothetical protein